MASSLAIGCAGHNSVVVDRVAGKLSIENRCNLRPLSVWICDHSRSGGWKAMISAAATMTTAAASRGLKNRMSLELHQGGRKKQGRRNDAVDAHERLDEWMRGSVVEIVKNLKEAPLLVQVYPKTKGDINDGSETMLMTEKKAVVEDWPVVKQKWEAGETPLPEGVIFVEELAEAETESDSEEGREKTTRAWGIVVQGKGVGFGPVCYLLKTSRVGSGMGLCCTHFCLVKVKSLRETVESQLKNCWLLQSQ